MPLQITCSTATCAIVHEPLLVGHYRSDVLAGTEHVVNQMIGGTMEQALAMGQYPERTRDPPAVRAPRPAMPLPGRRCARKP